MKCPNCNNDFKVIKYPDITYEECSACGGIFLDKNELNVLATGESGNIEFCSIDYDKHSDKFPERICVKCSTKMIKVNLLEMSDIIFDYCEKCGGFFVDRGEIDEMNSYLRSISPSNTAQEFRGEVNEILVRADIEYSFSIGTDMRYGGLPVDSAQMQFFLIISTYYKDSLNINLSIAEEPVIHKFLNLITDKFNNDCKVGNDKFDSKFFIKANDEAKLKQYFNSEVINLILEMVKSRPKVYNIHGKFSFNDERIIYKEGPYSDYPIYREDHRFDGIFNKMTEIAKRIK